MTIHKMHTVSTSQPYVALLFCKSRARFCEYIAIRQAYEYKFSKLLVGKAIFSTFHFWNCWRFVHCLSRTSHPRDDKHPTRASVANVNCKTCTQTCRPEKPTHLDCSFHECLGLTLWQSIQYWHCWLKENRGQGLELLASKTSRTQKPTISGIEPTRKKQGRQDAMALKWYLEPKWLR